VQTVAERRAKAAQAWAFDKEIVLVGAGTPIGIPGGADQCFPYSPHPEYRWLTGGARPGSILAFDPQEGWTHFTPAVTEAERVWDGVTVEPEGPYLADLEPWLEKRTGRPVAWLGVPLDITPTDRASSERAREVLSLVRRPKDEEEIALMERAAYATKEGHAKAVETIRPGVTERQIQIEMETAMLRAGATATGYASIVGTGTNSAVFHFTPGDRAVAPDDVVLIDAGAAVDGYVIDVTRTYAASGRFTSEQQEIYDAVNYVLARSIERCLPGQEWLEVHRLAALDLATRLVDLGIMKGHPESAVESEAIATFLPHGIGHMVGLGVRDASGTEPGRAGDRKAGGIRVRCDLPLRPGYVMTVEPGCYFIPALLNNADRREKFAEFIDWEKALALTSLGGVRLEDNILVTDNAPHNLTAAIPK